MTATVPPPFDQFLATADAVAAERPDVDLEMAREVFEEVATTLYNGLALDGLDEHDTRVVVAGCASTSCSRTRGTPYAPGRGALARRPVTSTTRSRCRVPTSSRRRCCVSEPVYEGAVDDACSRSRSVPPCRHVLAT